MRLRMRKSLVVLMVLFTSIAVSGCAQRKAAVLKDEPSPQNAAIPSMKTLKVADDGSKLEIALDHPVTYTFYKINEPLKAVIDFAQTDFSNIDKLVEVNKGIISKYEISKQNFGSGNLARLEIYLKGDAEFSVAADPNDKLKLIVNLVAKVVSEPAAVVVSADLTPPTPVKDVVAKDIVPIAVTETTMPAKVEVDLVKQAVVKQEIAVVNPAIDEKKLTSIAVVTDGVDIIVDGQLSNYNAFKLTKPERLVVDLFGVKSNVSSNVMRINAFGINQARVGLTQDKLRIVFDSTSGEIPPYHLEKTDKGLRLFVDKPQDVKVSIEKQIVEPVVAPKVVDNPPSSSIPIVTPPITANVAIRKNEIESLDFKLVDGYSQIIIRTGKGCRVGKVTKTSGGLTLPINSCQLPKNLQRYIDTSAFASVVKGITPIPTKSKKNSDARIQLNLRAEAPYRIKQDGFTTYWEIKNTEIPSEQARIAPIEGNKVNLVQTKVEEKELGEVVLAKGQQTTNKQIENKKTYSGRKVTLEFSDADVRKIFQLIAEVSNLNFLISDDVTGTISIKLVNVPWDHALDVILEAKQLAMKRDGNIVQIMQKTKMISQEQEDKNARDALELSLPQRTHIFELNYAKIDDLATQFTAMKSKRGIISKDVRTNRIIVKDIESNLDDMKMLLKSLDLPERQVMIEARIVEASSTFTRDLGVKWNVGYRDGSATFANINSVDSSFGGVVSSVLPTATTGGMATGFSFGKLASNMQLDMRLSAAASVGQVKVISTPKVLTLNNKKAKISQGQSVPYQTVSAEGTKTEFIEAVLTLEVTPHITADGNVGMVVKASNNSVGVGSPPPINKKEATTELVVKNGETTVIGGIYIDSDNESEQGVPFLMDVPLLGWMFKSNSKTKSKTELLIFITPKVIN